MKRDEILNMPAGREMDALIAEKVMGFEYRNLSQGWYRDDGKHTLFIPEEDFMPSTDIAAAWEVVEKMMEDGDIFIEYWSDGEWFVSDGVVGYREGHIKAHCDGKKTGKPSAPLAICRAALLATMEVEE